MVEGGAGSIARRVADELGDAVRLSAPVRSIAQHDDRVVVDRRRASSVSARHAVVAVPPALALEIDVRSRRCPSDRLTLYRNAVARPGDEDARRVRRAVLARRRLQRPDRRARARPPRSRSTRRPRRDGPASSRRSRSGPSPKRLDALDPAERRRAVLDALTHAARPARRVAGRVHRDRVVERGVDARLLDGAPAARASSRATGRCCASRSAACTGPAPRPRRRRTARSTAPSAPGERAAAEILDRT